MTSIEKIRSLKVADEVFIVVATLHQDNPDREDFSVKEILAKAEEMKLNGTMRPGFQVHVRMHCVANLEPNPGDYRMLYASGKARRRLLKRSDIVHKDRQGKIFPEIGDLDPKFFSLVEWAKSRYASSGERKSIYSRLLELSGSGKELWADEPADEYVARLRGGWD